MQAHGIDSRRIYCGNAEVDGAGEGRGWFIGNFDFLSNQTLRKTKEVEVKLVHHKAGDRRSTTAQAQEAMTLSILIKGRFRIELEAGYAVLEQQGDYVLFGPEEHTWEALTDVLIIVVRWPLNKKEKA